MKLLGCCTMLHVSGGSREHRLIFTSVNVVVPTSLMVPDGYCITLVLLMIANHHYN